MASAQTLSPGDDAEPSKRDAESIRLHVKRLMCILAVQRSFPLTAALELVREGYFTVDRLPEAPNPWKRNVSKRQWEDSVQRFRTSLKLLVIFTRWSSLISLLRL